jgi:protein involved in polysaccharide export with SLBB domain
MLLVLSGCTAGGTKIDQKIMAEKASATSTVSPIESYLVGFPDVLEIDTAGHPELSGRCSVGTDGRIDLRVYGKVRVEGLTVSEIGRAIRARTAGIDPSASDLKAVALESRPDWQAAPQVRVSVIDYQSQPLFLFGQVTGLQRTVPYQGQETVLELLKRVGGITPGAAPEDVYVVRAHIADGQRPEVFHVDLDAILSKQDQSSNIRLLPFDQVYVGESRYARFLKCIPPCLRPVFYVIWGNKLSKPGE